MAEEATTTESTATEEVSPETESTAKDTAESTPSEKAYVSPEAEHTEASKLGVKLMMQHRRQATAAPADVEEKADTSETADSEKQTGKTDKKTDEKPVLDPDLQKFAEGKGFDIEKVTASEDLQKSIKMSMESEKQMNKVQNEATIKEDKIKQKQLDKDADAVVNPKPEADPDEPKSPSASTEEQIQNQFENLLSHLGVADENDLVAKWPDVYERFVASANHARNEAARQDLKFEASEQKRKTDEESSAETMEGEFKKVAGFATDNIAEIKKDYPTLVEDMKASGVDVFVDRWADVVKIPREYFMASKEFLADIAKFSKAMVEVSKLPERDEKTKQQMEKDLKKTKDAEMVASGSPLPDDNRTVAQKAMNDKSARFQKKHSPNKIT